MQLDICRKQGEWINRFGSPLLVSWMDGAKVLHLCSSGLFSHWVVGSLSCTERRPPCGQQQSIRGRGAAGTKEEEKWPGSKEWTVYCSVRKEGRERERERERDLIPRIRCKSLYGPLSCVGTYPTQHPLCPHPSRHMQLPRQWRMEVRLREIMRNHTAC